MARTGKPGFRRYFKVGPVALDWVGSWDSPMYPLVGAWRTEGAVTLRFRGWLLVLA